MTTRNDWLRAFGLLLVAFVAGGAAGVAADRAWWHPAAGARTEPPRRDPSRRRWEGVELEQIPTPLERLQLSDEETRRLHAIARRWRPKAAAELARIRPVVSDLENDMFAEMLCAISKDKQDHYLRELQHQNGADSAMVAKRFRLVRTNQCPPV
ncbi:MAG TPA: hypothetical protein VJO33_02830 [Gemmatimonadaceae bacterium]|nr:hypothetical protein [Gemmatimonadaceae bacterium]